MARNSFSRRSSVCFFRNCLVVSTDYLKITIVFCFWFSEYLAQVSSKQFWNFVDRLESLVSTGASEIFSLSDNITSAAINELENIVLDVQGVLSEGNSNQDLQRRLFRLTLASRALSPAVQTANHMAFVAQFQRKPEMPFSCASSATWARIGSHLICDLHSLESTVESCLEACSSGNAVKIAEFVLNLGCPPGLADSALLSDNVYDVFDGASPSIPRLVLYGDLRCKEFYAWHAKAKFFAKKRFVVYIFRHFFKVRDPLLFMCLDSR